MISKNMKIRSSVSRLNITALNRELCDGYPDAFAGMNPLPMQCNPDQNLFERISHSDCRHGYFMPVVRSDLVLQEGEFLLAAQDTWMNPETGSSEVKFGPWGESALVQQKQQLSPEKRRLFEFSLDC